jgi:hypothetical protein
MGEVAHQEEVVQTLQRALETANVRVQLTTSSLCGLPPALQLASMPYSSNMQRSATTALPGR